MTFEERRAAVEAARDALAGIEGELWAAGGEELGEFAQLLDELRVRTESGQVDVLAEAVERGEAGTGRSGASAWLLDRSPSLRAGGSARVVRVAEAVADDRYAVLTAAVREGRVPLVTAQVVVEELERLAPRLAEGAEQAVLDGLVDVASWGRPPQVRQLRQRLVARYGAPGEFQADADRVRELRSLSQPSGAWGSDAPVAGGLFEYTLVVDARGDGGDRGRGAGSVRAAPC